MTLLPHTAPGSSDAQAATTLSDLPDGAVFDVRDRHLGAAARQLLADGRADPGAAAGGLSDLVEGEPDLLCLDMTRK